MSCPNGTHISPKKNHLCEDDLICPKYYNYDKTKCLDEIPEGFYLNDSNSQTLYKCDDKCKNCSFESTMQGKCILCNISAGYYPLYNNDSNNQTFISCYNESIEGYAFFNNSYMPCFRTCHNCSEIGDENNNKCIYCKSNYEFKEEMNDTQNCYEKCDKDRYYFFDELNNYKCTKECPDKYNKLIREKGKCIDDCSKDKLYRFEYNNICYSAYPEITDIFTNKCTILELFNGLCKLESNNNDKKNLIEEKDAIVSNIRDLIFTGELDSIFNIMTNENNKDLIINDNSTIYQIVSTDKQNNRRENNVSIVELGECEKVLRSHYNMSNQSSLLILKLDIYVEGSITPRIEYEVYDSKTKEKLDLSICNHTKINILVPAIIDINNIYKYNISDEYYNNICITYTTEYGTDLILADRKNEFIKNNMSLCESNCKYRGYDEEIKKAKCECEVKTEISLFSKIIESIKNLDILKIILDITNVLNLDVMKCYKNAFSAKYIKGNIGSHIILSFIVTISICLVHFLLKGFSIIKGYINSNNSFKNPNDNMVTERNEQQQNERNDGENAQINIKGKIKKKKKKKKVKQKKIKNVNINLLNQNVITNNAQEVKANDDENNNRFKQNKVESPPKKKRKRNKGNNNNIRNIKTNGEETSKGNTYSILEWNNNKKDKIIKLNVEPPKEDIKKKKQTHDNNINNKINNNLTTTIYNDYEMNSLDYKVAILIDKRNYNQYSLSLLKRKHTLIFTFYTINDYNSREIKISLFFFSFALQFTVNLIFFDESTIRRINEDKGAFNLNYQLPRIIYSTLISIILNKVTAFLSLSEKTILEFKNKNSKNETKQDVIKKLTIKFILFFVLIYLLLIFFWYYITCFGAVYINSQIQLLKDTLISYILSLLYPFGECLLPGIFRIPSLASKKANKECLYRLSQFIELI